MKFKASTLLILSLFLSFSCGKNEDDNSDKKEMFSNYADNLILPAYNLYGNILSLLQRDLDTFKASPSLLSLQQLQNSFTGAYGYWQDCEIYEKTDPANNVMAIENINFYPTRVDSINAYIARNENSTSFIKTRNKNDKGLPAIEYLLFSRTGNNQQILDRFTTDANSASYNAYLTSLIANLIEINTTILNEWNTSYKANFISNVSTDAAGSFSVMVNSIAQRADDLKRHQVGIPAGYSGNVATSDVYPNAVQGYYTRSSIVYMIATLENMKNVMYGKNPSTSIDGTGLYDYLKTLNVTSTFGGNLADDIITQIDVCKSKVAECGPDYEQTLLNNKAKADVLFLETKKLLVLMKVDLPSAFGVSITYSDSDGD
jgi:hypothetical protein